MTKFPDLFAALAAPFDGRDEVKTLSVQGRSFSYINVWTVMNRLDEVLGPENWRAEYEPRESSVVCRLTITLPDGTEIARVDAGAYAGMSDEGDDEKSGYSDSLKRAARGLGVGRDLCRCRAPRFAGGGDAAEPGQVPVPITAPAPALPAPRADGIRRADEDAGQASQPPDPRTGAALYAWALRRREETGRNVLNLLTEWGKLQGCPSRLREWPPQAVADGLAEARRRLAYAVGEKAAG